MARQLRLDVDSDASGARAGLAATAKAVDHLADETNRLEREFREASREAAKLDRKLLETAAAAKTLGQEFARTQDKSVLAQIEAHNKAAAEIRRVQAAIVGDSEVKAKQSAKAWRSAFADLTKLGGAGPGIAGSLGSAGIPYLSALVKNPGLAAAGAAIAIPATIGVGATIGGGIGAGLGAGVAGITVAGAAMQSKQVHAAWSREIEGIRQEFIHATAPGVEPTIAAIQRIGGAVRGLNMDHIFGDAAKFIEPLSEGLAKGLTAAGKGLEYLVHRAGPYVTALSDGAAEIGHGFQVAFEEIGDGSKGGAKALGDFLHATTVVIEGTGRFIHWTENAYDAVDQLGNKLRSLPQVDLLAQIAPGADEPKSFGRRLNFEKPDLSGLEDVKTAAQNAANAIKELNHAFDESKGNSLDLSNAHIQSAQNLANLRKEFAENGKTIDINTQKGRDNLSAINDTIGGYIRERDAAIAAGGGTEEAYRKAQATYNQQIAALEGLLVKLGLSKQAAHALMAEFTDKDVTVNVKVKVHQQGDVSSQGVILSGDLRRAVGSAYAAGTDYAKGGLALVGEKGPELVQVPRGAKVYTAGETAKMVTGWTQAPSPARIASMVGAGRGSSSPVSVNVNFPTGPANGLEGMFRSWFMEQLRIGQIIISASAVH